MLNASWNTAKTLAALTGVVAVVGSLAAAVRPGPATITQADLDAASVGVMRAHQEADALNNGPAPMAHPELQGIQEARALNAGALATVHPEAQGVQEAAALHAVFQEPSTAPRSRPGL